MSTCCCLDSFSPSVRCNIEKEDELGTLSNILEARVSGHDSLGLNPSLDTTLCVTLGKSPTVSVFSASSFTVGTDIAFFKLGGLKWSVVQPSGPR